MKTILARLAFLAAMLPTLAVAEQKEIPGSETKVGDWIIVATADDGRFKDCYMRGAYGALVMYFVITGKDQFRIGMRHNPWRSLSGQRVGMDLWVDQFSPRTVEGTVTPTGVFWADIADGPVVIEQLRFGNQLHVRGPGLSHSFNLTQTSAALAAVRDCSTKYRAAAPPPSGSAPDGAPSVAVLPTLTPDQRVEAIRMAANLLTRLPGFRLLNEEEQKKLAPMAAALKPAVVWSGDKTFGMLHIIPNVTEAEIPKIAGAMIGAMVPLCKGGDVNASVMADVRSSTVRRVHMSCSAGEAQSHIRVILMPFKDGVYYLLAGADDPKDEASVIRAEELLRNALFEVGKK